MNKYVTHQPLKKYKTLMENFLILCYLSLSYKLFIRKTYSIKSILAFFVIIYKYFVITCLFTS